MTAQVEIFCTPTDERRILEYLRASGRVVPFNCQLTRRGKLPLVDLDDLPPFPEPVAFFLWLKPAGRLEWHRRRPLLRAGSHRRLVTSLIDQLNWDELRPRSGERMLDTDRSPVLRYERCAFEDGSIAPCLLLSEASNMQRVSDDFARWATRCLRWVRRQGTIVHDYHRPTTSIPNPSGSLNTVYAMPEALAQIEGGSHRYAISCR